MLADYKERCHGHSKFPREFFGKNLRFLQVYEGNL